ncbi:hypothetical protein LOAG_07816 [Loa loa]|uniref:Uncharacterized protein n=1 Tax=Loa loa TaxID=7209 RepID=A0A1I7VDG8_LOALO|nr:hypothetical protein LOAG_07816 [Loa loa]EFO20672.2 hypothetical protein LOAG_07816 [Loa loa]
MRGHGGKSMPYLALAYSAPPQHKHFIPLRLQHDLSAVRWVAAQDHPRCWPTTHRRTAG